MSDLGPELRPMRQKWVMTAGDTFWRELEITNVDLTDYTDLRCQIRGGHGLIEPECSILEGNIIRFFLADGIVTQRMDGWEGDAEIRTPSDELCTFLEIELVVREQYTEPT